MAVAQVVDARVNPNNPDQRVVLWGNGRIDVRNGPPVTNGPQWFDRIDQPVAVAIWITNWSTMAGYVLDKQGGFHEFNGAPVMGDDGRVIGVPYQDNGAGIYLDWSWDPNNTGRGVVLDGFGTLHPFGGAPTPPRPLNRWADPSIACRLAMSWTPGDIRAYTLDRFGGVHPDYAAVAAGAGYPYWSGYHAARHLAITNWATGAGYTLDLFGAVHAWGGAQPAPGFPYNNGGDWARVLVVLNPSNPLRLWEVWAGGQEFEWVASTPPTVTAGGIAQSPAATVTGTTRPMMAWTYSDPQQDSQAAWELFVFTSAFVVSHSMSDPAVWRSSALVAASGVDPSLRGIAPPVDFDNGSYRMYVRAQDTAGQWSAWSSRAWTQNVPLPATPTGLTATASDATLSVALSVTAATGGVANLVRFEWLDDDGVWRPVDGADAVPLAATTTAVDRFPPFGKPRTYRAVAYAVDPRTASLPSATQSATVSKRTYALHARDNAALGGEIGVQGPFEWDRELGGGIFEGLGAKFPTVVDDGVAKARRGSLKVICENAAEWVRVRGLAESRSTVVLRDPFGDVAYCQMVGNWPQRLLEASPTGSLAHMHTTDLPLVEVRPPHLEV